MNAFVGQTFQINQLINIHQVVEIVGVARSTVYAMMDEYSPYYDPTFPKKVKITQNRIGWSASNGLLSCLPLQLILRGKSTTQSYRTPVYYVDLTLREGIHLQEAIQTAKEIDQKSKLAGFNQNALDHMALQGYGNSQFEVDSEDGMNVVEEFYQGEEGQPTDEDKVFNIQQGLQGSVTALN